MDKDQPKTPRAPVSYIVLERSLIGNEIKEVGSEVLYDGLPAENLQPTCEEGERRAEEYQESNRQRQAAMRAQYGAEAQSAFGDPEKFTKMFAAELAKATAEATAQQAQMMEKLQQVIDGKDAQIAVLRDGQDAILKAVQGLAPAAAATTAKTPAKATDATKAKTTDTKSPGGAGDIA